MQVVAAIIIYQGKILCVQRDKHEYAYLSDKFEFPGGKIEAGETGEEALIREIKEELAIDISIDSLFCTIEHQYPDFFIELNCFICHVSSYLHTLHVHQQSRWMDPDLLAELDWAEADLPAVYQLIAEKPF